MITCCQLSDIPTVDHWAIVGSEVIEVPGYNKTDPNDRRPVFTYTAFLKKEEWLTAIRKMVEMNTLSNYRILEVKSPKLAINIEIGFEDE